MVFACTNHSNDSDNSSRSLGDIVSWQFIEKPSLQRASHGELTPEEKIQYDKYQCQSFFECKSEKKTLQDIVFVWGGGRLVPRVCEYPLFTQEKITEELSDPWSLSSVYKDMIEGNRLLYQQKLSSTGDMVYSYALILSFSMERQTYRSRQDALTHEVCSKVIPNWNDLGR